MCLATKLCFGMINWLLESMKYALKLYGMYMLNIYTGIYVVHSFSVHADMYSIYIEHICWFIQNVYIEHICWQGS